MRSIGSAKHFVAAFLLALIGYIVFYHSIEHRRVRNGPWDVVFTNAAAGSPSLLVNQPRLSIRNVQIVFVDAPPPATARPGSWAFDQPRPVPFDVPFGKCVFMDTTFLPGTLTFQLFGHEIELLPRVLIIDHQEHPWLPGAVFNLHVGPGSS